MLRRCLLLAAMLWITSFPAGGCRSCSDCHDYDPPVMGCDSCGCGQRAGSACDCGSCGGGDCGSCGGEMHGGYGGQFVPPEGQPYDGPPIPSQPNVEPVEEEVGA